MAAVELNELDAPLVDAAGADEEKQQEERSRDEKEAAATMPVSAADDVADDGVQIGTSGLGGVGLPRALEHLVVRNPHASAGPGGGTTEMRRLLDDDGG